ncbi:MAG TPA: hypothetical protein VH253_06245 [Phycisphaerae bacterium]|nr:hypothetical protein [Phycisphaerae bacterium]
MPDKAGDTFSSKGYDYVLDRGSEGDLRPYYKGKSDNKKSDEGSGLAAILISAAIPVVLAAAGAAYEWWKNRKRPGTN